MADCSKNKNPLVRSGTSQGSRTLPALLPTSVQVIDKQPEDWMVWAARLAARIRYYDLNNQISGTFAIFFQKDLAARLAAVATHRLDIFPDFFREQLIVLGDGDNSADTALLGATYTGLYDVLFSYLAEVDRHYRLAVQARDAVRQGAAEEDADAIAAPFDEYAMQLGNHIRLRLLSLAARAAAFHGASDTASLLVEADAPAVDIFHTPAVTASRVLAAGLSDAWWQGSASWSAWVSSVPDDASIFGSVAATPAEKIQHAARHHFFTGLLDEVTASSGFVVGLAERTMEKLFAEWPYHPPQYALFLAWLQLMEHAREGTNRLVGRHLDFYYREVLRLAPQSAAADTAFLAIELAKAFPSFALKGATAFNGGKDDGGKPIVFSSVKDVVLNRAALARFMAVYVHDEDTAAAKDKGRVFAAPVINSADGLGADLESELGQWHPFFIRQKSDTGEISVLMPHADIGFAVTSHYLFLAEGKRTITLRLALDDVPAFLPHADFDCWITTEKDWLAVAATVASGKMQDGVTSAAVFTLEIAGDKPAVTAWRKDVHGHTFSTAYPVVKFLLRHDATESYAYRHLLARSITGLEVEVKVGATSGVFDGDGITDLELHNDLGQLNPAKPILPWGAEPTVGNSFVIGCAELASKPGARVQLNFEWKDLPATSGQLDYDYSSTADYHSIPTTNDPNSPDVEISTLEGGGWVLQQDDVTLIATSGSTVDPRRVFLLSTPPGEGFFIGRDDAFTPFSGAAKKGFFRIRLKHDFGHRNYRHALTNYLLKKGNNPALTTSEPATPYQPVLQSCRLGYTAACAAAISTASGAASGGAVARLLHLAPFGDAEPLADSAGAAVALLPQVAVRSGAELPAQGEWYLGFENLSPGQSHSLLIQLMEGSEDPLREKPDEHVSWWYLAGDAWKEFGDALQDGTKQLIQSGLVEFAVPVDATTDNTILPGGYLWIKARVTEAPEAACAVLGVHCNAVEVRRASAATVRDGMVSLAAGAIAKLLTPDAAVKKVQQPYPTSGGRAEEASDAYRLRVSERLRHKDRAITIWDYERLVLQAFPEIYKVKCLNHTKISGSASEGTLEYNEVAPGHVTVITVPDLRNRNDADPLRPYTKVSVLERIEEFLANRISCHVRLATAQPQFEEVRMACRVVLAEGYIDVKYYTGELQREVTEFLSPWAFGGAGAIEFSGRIHKSVVIDFIEERPYVEFITDVRMHHKAGETAVEGGDVDEAVASTARSILVSAAAVKHEFTVELPEAVSQDEECDEKREKR
jgi:hypothetical protein